MLDISLGASLPFNIPQLRILCLALYPILIGLFGSLESNFLSSLCILDISPLSDPRNKIKDTEMNQHTFSHLVFDKGAKTIQWKKTAFSKMMLVQTAVLM